MTKKLGKFIVISGTDGSGKATQTKLLIDRLKLEKYDVETIEFPQYGNKSAALVEEYLNGKFGKANEVTPYQASIFYACDRFAAAPKIRQWLSEGKTVIANRYVSANMGHQTGKIKDNDKRDKFLKWLEELEFGIFNIPRPDVNILLFVPPEVGQTLVDSKGHRDYVGGEKRDIHEADINHLKDAADAYKYVANKYSWPIIDCTKDGKLMTITDIHEMVWEKVLELI